MIGLWYIPENRAGYITVVMGKGFWNTHIWAYWQPYDEACKREYVVLISVEEMSAIETRIKYKFGLHVNQNR